MTASAVVLLSGGLDSGYNLHQASRQLNVKLVTTFDYGQKAAKREIETSRMLCTSLKLKHQVIELPWFRFFTETALVGKAELASGALVKIDDAETSQETAKNVWVPNRNGIFLNIAAGFAEGLGCEYVVPGFNLEEAQTFPDNTGEFLKALDGSLAFSTANHVRGRCFSLNLNKTEIVAESMKIGVPLEKLWPCYLAGERWCGECESCQRFARALKMNGLDFNELRS